MAVKYVLKQFAEDAARCMELEKSRPVSETGFSGYAAAVKSAIGAEVGMAELLATLFDREGE